MILIDSSGSIQDANWESVLEMLRLLIAAIDSHSTLSVTSRAAIINYSNTAVLEINLSQQLDKNAILHAIDTSITYQRGDATDIRTAANLARDVLANNTRTVSGSIRATQAVILFTDGKQTVRVSGILPSQEELDQLLIDTENELVATLHGMMDQGVHVTMIGKYIITSVSFFLQ